MKPIQLFVPIFFAKIFFSKPKKELLPVALFWQEKINFLQKSIFTTIWAKPTQS
jgi:hypothetical protein